MEKVRLVDFVDVNTLQKIQDAFSEFTGLAALTTDEEGVPITEGSGFTEFCMDLTRCSAIGESRCEECDKRGAMLTMQNGHATVYDCHAGLADFAAPIMIENQRVGGFIGGQVRIADMDEKRIVRNAMELEIEPEKYIAALHRTKEMDRKEVERAAVFLEKIASTISDMAYRNYLAMQKSKRLQFEANAKSQFILELCNRLKESNVPVPSEIDEALEYIHLVNGELQLMETYYPVEDLIEMVLESVYETAKEKGVEIIPKVEPSVPSQLFGDAGRIGRILGKSIQILLKYKQRGRIEICFSAKHFSYATNFVVTITDNDTGISMDEDQRICKYLDNAVIDPEGQEFGTPWIKPMLEQMAGSVCVERVNHYTRLRYVFPQLDEVKRNV